MKAFNTAGTCRPNEHYMVDITERLEIIRKMVAKGDYFCINRGRQYGKTTTLEAIRRQLSDEYCVFSISFEGIDDTFFQNAATANATFLRLLRRETRNAPEGDKVKELLDEVAPRGLKAVDDFDFSDIVVELCELSTKPIVILIDEVDQAGNNDGFIKFLGGLRKMYLQRASHPTFRSVILAGVYDIKNLKLKIRDEEEHQYNSPWNIAVPFDVDMSHSAEGIAGMLAEYKIDHNLTFDEVFVGQMIRDYTAGYPFLVSRICQIIDAEQYSWDKEGILKAVNAILVGDEPFWKDAKRTIENDEDLKDLLQCVIEGQYVCYEPYAKGMKAALEHDFIKRTKTPVEIASPLHEGYLLSFCFRSATKGDACQSKNKNKQSGLLPPVELNGRTLIEAIV